MNRNETMDLSPEERAWRDSAGRALRESEQQFDAVTVARLRAARARAVGSIGVFEHRHASWGFPMALAAGLLAVVLVPRMSFEPRPGLPVNVAESHALEMLTDRVGPEFYRNLDFYLWLEESGGSA
jgi:hypothetical protein